MERLPTWCDDRAFVANVAVDMEPAIHIACLCASWCRTCEGYRRAFDLAARDAVAGDVPLRLHWIDIEVESDLVGDLDIATFPTIVIVDGAQVRYAGAITPEPDTLKRLLRARVIEADADTRWPVVVPEVAEFAARLRLRPAAEDGV